MAALGSAASDVAVVVHKANRTRNLSFAELTKICKLQSRKWPDGRDVVVVMRDLNTPETKLALRKLGMTPEDARALFGASGPGRATILVALSDDVLIQAVATNPGAIGLVDVYSINGAITVLKVDGKSPLEPGYALHGN